MSLEQVSEKLINQISQIRKSVIELKMKREQRKEVGKVLIELLDKIFRLVKGITDVPERTYDVDVKLGKDHEVKMITVKIDHYYGLQISLNVNSSWESLLYFLKSWGYKYVHYIAELLPYVAWALEKYLDELPELVKVEEERVQVVERVIDALKEAAAPLLFEEEVAKS